jgi:mRNA interferase RelE/StbE
MPIYKIEFVKSAQKELSKLPQQTRLRIIRAIHGLRSDPRIGNVRPMVGTKSWRLRVGDYRVLYDISDGTLKVLVIRIRHRRDIYRK